MRGLNNSHMIKINSGDLIFLSCTFGSLYSSTRTLFAPVHLLSTYSTDFFLSLWHVPHFRWLNVNAMNLVYALVIHLKSYTILYLIGPDFCVIFNFIVFLFESGRAKYPIYQFSSDKKINKIQDEKIVTR
jgi:hypothetical protein